jgi:hypothetical protein
MNQKMASERLWEITIESNWIITIGMALLFGFTAFLLGWSIRDILFGKVGYGILHGVRRGWLDTLPNPIGAIYFFLFAYAFPPKHLKVAFLLLGANYTVLFALTYLPVAAGVQHFVAVAGSIATQGAICHRVESIIRARP